MYHQSIRDRWGLYHSESNTRTSPRTSPGHHYYGSKGYSKAPKSADMKPPRAAVDEIKHIDDDGEEEGEEIKQNGAPLKIALYDRCEHIRCLIKVSGQYFTYLDLLSEMYRN